MPRRRTLEDYEAKRDFRKTPEPRGKTARADRKERLFCVQKHLASHLHYDFRLEHRGVLLSWAVPKGPSLDPADKRLAMMVEDHPLEYGSFEGVIPEGYGAGIVMLWDTGSWTPHPDFADVDAALRKGELKFELNGYKLKGSWVLVRTGRRGEAAGRQWLLIKHRDDWAGPIDVTEVAPRSVTTDRDFAEVLADAMEESAVWRSHRPSRGGASGEMLAKIIDEAARIQVERMRSRKRAPKARASARTRGKAGTQPRRKQAGARRKKPPRRG
jgi:bifunctional non-homologous end joining protein LigD